MITLTVNGKEQQLEGPTKLTAFLETLEIDPRYVAVARNGSVVRREEWPQVVLEDGDVLEIVRMVGGGQADGDPRSTPSGTAARRDGCRGWAFPPGGRRCG